MIRVNLVQPADAKAVAFQVTREKAESSAMD